MLKFGKKSKDILEVKKVLLLKTKACLNGKENYINYTLINQKENTVKTVKKKIKGERFEKLGIEYIICNNCKHVNGIYQDTKLLSKKFYQTDEAKSYSKIYLKTKESYNKRIKIFIFLILFF